jgi:hypothetical protein
MADRRSLGDALTPEKLAFIHGDRNKAAPAPTVKTPAPQTEKIIEVNEGADETEERNVRPQRRRSRGRSTVQDEPEASEILDRMLVPVTIRLQNRTAQALKRASLERELQRVRPHKVQDIAEEAIVEWLSKSDYLE